MVTLYGHEIAVKIDDVGDESGVQRLQQSWAARVQWLKENSNNTPSTAQLPRPSTKHHRFVGSLIFYR